MRIVIIAAFLLCVSISTSMVDAAGIFPSTDDAPTGIEDVETEMSGTQTRLESAPSAPTLIELISSLVWSGVNFVGMIIEVPTAFATLIGAVIPGNEPVEVVFVSGIRGVIVFIYILALIQIIRGFSVE